MDDPYKTLGVSHGSSLEDIKSAFRTLAKRHHPDHGGDVAVFKKLSSAYSFLMKEHVRQPKGSQSNSWPRDSYIFDPETGRYWSPHERDRDGFAVKETRTEQTEEEFQKQARALREYKKRFRF